MLVAFSTRRQRRPSLLSCARHCPATRRVILRRGDARRAFLARLFGWFRRRLIRRREFCGRSRHRHHPLFPHLRQEFSLCQCRVLFLCRLESVEQFQALCGLRLGEAGHFHVPAVYLPPVLRGEFQSLAGSGNLKSPPVLAIAAQPAVQRSANFQVCCAADFQIGTLRKVIASAGLEARGTADLEVCATKADLHPNPLPCAETACPSRERMQNGCSC